MRPKAGITAWVLLLFLGISFRCYSQYITTDAAGGIFREDQNLSFSIPENGWLRLLLDNKELYRGRGPAYPELGVNRGEERGFTLGAEYYSAQDELLESRSWYIFIDKNPPSIPDLGIRNRAGGLYMPGTAGKRDAKIRALAGMDGNLVFFPDLGGEGLLPPLSFPALVWAEDLAGNFTGPRSEYFDISLVKIDNPVSGGWLNPQVLIISGAEGKDVYWTIDGTHPLTAGGTGRLYRGPERIEKCGRVFLRIAWRNSADRIMEDSVVYSVAENDEGGFPENLNVFRLAEERPVNSVTVLPVPESCPWSIGGIPRDQGTDSISLRPQALVKRTTAIHLSPVSKGMGIYRFAYTLDGTGNSAQPLSFSAAESMDFSGTPSETKTLLYPGPQREAGKYDLIPLTLVSLGVSRVIVWPNLTDPLYYSWGDSDSWLEAHTPLSVPLEGGTLKWFMTEAETHDGGTGQSYKKTFPAGGFYSVNITNLKTNQKETQRGRIAFSNFDENGNSHWEYVSGLLDYTPGIVKGRSAVEACDGEDLVWAFVSSGGQILEEQRRNRLAPAAPLLDAPPEGGWSRGPVKLSVVSGGKETTGIITALLRYASGTVEVLSGKGSLVIDSPSGEIAEVTVESLLLDNSGNRSPLTMRHFTIDPKTTYVSSVPLLSGTAGKPGARGSLDNPYASLEEALDFVMRQDSGDIRIAGRQELRRPVTVSRNIHIDGGWRKTGDVPGDNASGASLVLADGFFWDIRAGAGLQLSGLSLERNGGDNPLIQASGNLDITASIITNAGPLLNMDGGLCRIRNSRISIKVTGERRVAAISARGSDLELDSSRIQVEGNYCLLFDMTGGSFSGTDSVLLSAGLRTASLFAFDSTRGNFTNLTLNAAAGDYASILEASLSQLIISGGILEVSSRDAVSLLLDNCAAVIMNAQILVEGTFSVRAAEIRGAFPIVRNTRFTSAGSAKKTDVFSGMETAPPQAGGISGNRFSGFDRIWGDQWPLEKLSAFNSAFASGAEPNS